MTAIIYFGEMLVASVLAIVLLAISQLRMSSGAALFAGGVVALTHITPSSMSISLATSDIQSSSSPRSLATRLIVVTWWTLLSVAISTHDGLYQISSIVTR